MENKGHSTNLVSSSSHVNEDCGFECDAAVLQSDTLTKAENYPWWGGDIKIPVVLDEFIIQIDTESKIRLNERAFEIKRIENQVFLTECRYIAQTNKVFIEGYIRKNIEYAVRSCSKGSGIGGSIKDTTVHIPFRAYTKVKFKGATPKIQPNLPSNVARYFDQEIMGKNFREADRSNIEIFNEPVFCELEWSAVYTADIDNVGTPIEGFRNEEEFQELTDKSVVYLCMKLLQKQQVCWPDSHGPHDKKPACLKSDWSMTAPGFEDKDDYK
jgi:hypothetical protein